MREYLQAHFVEFDERNIRQSGEARAELQSLTGNLIVPLVVHGNRRVVGFDPDGLDNVVSSYFAAKSHQ